MPCFQTSSIHSGSSCCFSELVFAEPLPRRSALLRLAVLVQLPLLLEGQNTATDLNTAVVAYASIGLEVVSSTIAAFRGTFRPGDDGSAQNIATLCAHTPGFAGGR